MLISFVSAAITEFVSFLDFAIWKICVNNVGDLILLSSVKRKNNTISCLPACAHLLASVQWLEKLFALLFRSAPLSVLFNTTVCF